MTRDAHLFSFIERHPMPHERGLPFRVLPRRSLPEGLRQVRGAGLRISVQPRQMHVRLTFQPQLFFLSFFLSFFFHFLFSQDRKEGEHPVPRVSLRGGHGAVAERLQLTLRRRHELRRHDALGPLRARGQAIVSTLVADRKMSCKT